MHRHATCDANTDRGDLAGWVGRCTPHATSTCHLLSRNVVVSTRAHDGGFESPDMRNDIERLTKRNDWIAHQLPWTMPCDSTAAINFDHFDAVSRSIFWLSAFAGGECGLVFQEEQRRWCFTADNFLVHLPLQVPALLIRN